MSVPASLQAEQPISPGGTQSVLQTHSNLPERGCLPKRGKFILKGTSLRAMGEKSSYFYSLSKFLAAGMSVLRYGLIHVYWFKSQSENEGRWWGGDFHNSSSFQLLPLPSPSYTFFPFYLFWMLEYNIYPFI